MCDGISLLDVTHDEAAQALKKAMDMESVRNFVSYLQCEPCNQGHLEQLYRNPDVAYLTNQLDIISDLQTSDLYFSQTFSHK